MFDCKSVTVQNVHSAVSVFVQQGHCTALHCTCNPHTRTVNPPMLRQRCQLLVNLMD